MTPEQQRIAIAEACGWKHYGCTGCSSSPCRCAEWIHESTDWTPSSLPDYLNDLNAMHEAILTLEVSQWKLFVTHLQMVALKITKDDDIIYRDMCLLGSTASQRAEAFLKTIGKWVE